MYRCFYIINIGETSGTRISFGINILSYLMNVLPRNQLLLGSGLSCCGSRKRAPWKPRITTHSHDPQAPLSSVMHACIIDPPLLWNQGNHSSVRPSQYTFPSSLTFLHFNKWEELECLENTFPRKWDASPAPFPPYTCSTYHCTGAAEASVCVQLAGGGNKGGVDFSWWC